MFALSSSKDMRIRKFEFVTKTQFRGFKNEKSLFLTKKSKYSGYN